MVDIRTLITNLDRDGTFRNLGLSNRSQMGTAGRTLLGASLMPERLVPNNAYRETGIRYRTIVANDGTRYSPPVPRGGALVGSFMVELGESDIASQLTASDYEALISLLMTSQDMDAVAQLIRFVDMTIIQAFQDRNEVQRWQAIVSAAISRVGDNGYSETVSFSNPAGHRAAAGGTWSSDAYDPFDDIQAMATLLASKGYQVSRIITSRAVVAILAGNAKVAARTGRFTVSAGNVVVQSGRATLDSINAALMSDALPTIETYDLLYTKPDGSTDRFLPAATMVMVATTGRDPALDMGTSVQLAGPADTLGYTAIGRVAGFPTPGRQVRAAYKDELPPRVEAEGKQTALPILTAPEGVAVINTIS